MKLYRVTLRGLGPLMGAGGVNRQVSHVVAEDAESAYKVVRAFVDKKDYGSSADRELDKIELLADDAEYTDTPSQLFFAKPTKFIYDEARVPYGVIDPFFPVSPVSPVSPVPPAASPSDARDMTVLQPKTSVLP